MKWNAEQFWKDLGVNLDVKELNNEIESINGEPVQDLSNILTFFNSKSLRMDDPRSAVQIQLRNLIITYGLEIVKEAMNVESK